MDELQSVGVGIALGLIMVSFLALFPGEPFDYSTNSVDNRENEHQPATSAKNGDHAYSSETRSATAIGETHTNKKYQIATIEQAAQRVKVQKLQELLGMEKEKAEQLIQRAKDQAVDAITTDEQSSPSRYSVSSKSSWLDRCFFIVMFGLLAWVLWQDYSINLASIAAHMLPREAAVVRQVIAAPRDLLAQVFALFE